jgi:hypothetical protein
MLISSLVDSNVIQAVTPLEKKRRETKSLRYNQTHQKLVKGTISYPSRKDNSVHLEPTYE